MIDARIRRQHSAGAVRATEPAQLLEEDASMVYGDLIRSIARRSPNVLGIVFEGYRFTWGEVNERVNRLANGLLALGLAKGDRVAIFAQNSHRFAEAYFALAKAGMVSVPVNWQSPAPEATYIIDNAGAKAMLADEQFMPFIASIAPQLESVKHIVRMGGSEGTGGEGLDYEALLAASPASEPAIEVLPEDIRSFVYTSGTTGMPKGCVTTHEQSLVSYANFLIEIPMPRELPTLLATPFFTGFGAHLCFDAPYSRSPMIILRKFDPTAVFQAIEQHKVSHMSVVPTMISAMCNAADVGDYDLSSLRLVCYGGSPISPSVLKRAIAALKCDFCQLFGTAEAGGLVAYLTPEDHRLDGSGEEKMRKEKRLLSTGREALYAEIRFLNEEGKDCETNEPGEMIVRSASTISGYWKMPEKTAETIREGWVYTGDVGYRDRDGYIYIIDRKKEMIVTGGVNVYPAEIEAVLYTHPAILQAAVIGVPDPHWGEAVKAVVELREGAQATEAEIIEFCRERLASFKKPKSVDFAKGLVSTSGKIAKRELRERYWKGHARRVN